MTRWVSALAAVVVAGAAVGFLSSGRAPQSRPVAPPTALPVISVPYVDQSGTAIEIRIAPGSGSSVMVVQPGSRALP